jgi:hypothetical protein
MSYTKTAEPRTGDHTRLACPIRRLAGFQPLGGRSRPSGLEKFNSMSRKVIFTPSSAPFPGFSGTSAVLMSCHPGNGPILDRFWTGFPGGNLRPLPSHPLPHLATAGPSAFSVHPFLCGRARQKTVPKGAKRFQKGPSDKARTDCMRPACSIRRPRRIAPPWGPLLATWPRKIQFYVTKSHGKSSLATSRPPDPGRQTLKT